MKTILKLISIISLSITNVYATAQISDVVNYKGKTYALQCNPLESFFNTYPERKPKGGIISTALWRGYQATFEIRDSILCIKDIEIEASVKGANGKDSSVWKSVIESVFPDSSERICNFYTGLLILPEGELLSYVHMGYSSVYEEYILINIKSGIIKKAKQLSGADYMKFKKRQFEKYKMTTEYKEEYERLKEKGYAASDIEDFLFVFDVEYSNRFLLDEF